MSRYDPLYGFLKDFKDKNEIILTLKEIEGILGKKLPQKAYTEIQRWENSDSHTKARAWLRAGWKVENPSDVVKTGEVKFVKQLDNSNNNETENIEKEIEDSNQENKSVTSISCLSLVYMIGIPIIPLGLADLPPQYVPVLMIVQPIEFEKVGSGLKRALGDDNPMHCAG